MPEERVDVSIIVAVRNGSATIAQCIDSVLGQTGCAVEVIVVDALSDDGTEEIVDSYGDAIATSIREADSGIYDAWNKALAAARGEWCAFLGSDDYYRDDSSVANLIACARRSAEPPVFVYGGVIRTGGAQDYVLHPDPKDPVKYLHGGNMLPHPGALHRVEALQRIGGFDASFRISGDRDALHRLLKVGQAARCSSIVTVMRVGGVSSDPDMLRLAATEGYRIMHRERGIVVAAWHYLCRRSSQVVGEAVERSVLMLVGDRLGLRVLLALRRAIGRPPKLIRTSRTVGSEERVPR